MPPLYPHPPVTEFPERNPDFAVENGPEKIGGGAGTSSSGNIQIRRDLTRVRGSLASGGLFSNRIKTYFAEIQELTTCVITT